DTVYTVQDVVREIRDVKTRESLAVVLYALKFKEPSTEAIRVVTNFAKKTGDYAFLSAVDLRLLALTYQLYQENVGTENLNLEPKINATIPSSTTSFGDPGIKLAGFVFPKHEETGDQEPVNSTTESPVENQQEIVENENVDCEEEHEEEDNENEDVQSFVTAQDNDHDQLLESVNDLHLGHDNDGWITPSNIRTVKSKALDNGVTDNESVHESLPVACITTDFSMQNVLIQMGIPVLSVDGLLIRIARSYVLKCRVCPGVTRQMNKQFCPECGNPSLQRAGVTVDPSGQRHYHLTGRYRPQPRQTLPLPRGGKHANNPIRVEGQPRPQNRPTKKSLQKRNVLDDDYLADSSPFAVHDIYSRAATLVYNSDQSETLESSPTPLTRDFIGLCIGILSVVIVILIVAICKWSRCRCMKRFDDTDDNHGVFSSILQHNASTPHGNARRQYNYNHHQQDQHLSSCDHRPDNIYRHISNSRVDTISPVQATNNNGYRLNDVKVPRVTITTLPVQPTQQLVPRLSISPQVSGSSITRSSYSL
ncbi:unnamed protein product, partial [Adineta ricciae]